MKVALVYDRVNKFGGAERLLSVLHEIYPDAPLFTAVYNKTTARWADIFKVHTTFLQAIPFARTNHEYIAPVAPLAFEGLHFDDYDLAISITSEYAKGIVTKPKTLHICYCLTPTRYLWSGYEEYFANDVAKGVSKPLVSYLRSWDKIAAQRPDYYIAISKAVKARIKQYYGRESVVVYPPLSFGAWRVARGALTKNPRATSYEPYFLLVSRLVPYKRVDIAITAANKLGLRLKIVGTGRELGKLEKMAQTTASGRGGNIEFLGNLTDEALSRYYQNCIAFIFPGEEDLGLAILEAQSFGKPVIAFGSGGALETIKEGVTGEFFYPQTPEALTKIMKQFDLQQYDPKAGRENAEKFSKEHFKKEFTKTIKKLVSSHRLGVRI